MNYDALLTVAVVAGIFVALIKNLAPSDFLFLAGVAVLAMAGVITPEEAFVGFSNQGMLTLALLFVIAAGLRETGVLDYVGNQVLGAARTEQSVLRRLSIMVVPASAFLNNTPIVAMFIPVLLDWCRRREVPPSKLLIPLSYLAILGGTCTLIGTSTNLVVHGMMLQNGIEGMGLFEIGQVGLPYALVGIVYLMFVGPKLLPDRKELLEQLGSSRREYVVEMLVQPNCRLAGRTVEQAGLRNLPGLYLIEIDRDGEVITPVDPADVIRIHDRLVFTGVISSVVELQKIGGLVPASDPEVELPPTPPAGRRMCEAVISASSPIIGKSIRNADFRATYGAAVVAVHRGGSRVETKVGDIRLQPGDTLLLQTQQHFARAHRNNPAFYLVSDVEQWRPLRRDRAWVAIALFVALIVVMTTGLMSTLVAASLVASLMVATRCLSAGEARRSVEWQVLITISAAFGVGIAIQKSGAATSIAIPLVQVTQSWGPVATLACLYVMGSLLTEMITNNAVAVLLFPICLETAKLLGASPRPFIMAMTLAASASLMTPIGYQTNLLVFGPGGYRYSDFLRVGLPLNLTLIGVAIILVPIFWPFF